MTLISPATVSVPVVGRECPATGTVKSGCSASGSELSLDSPIHSQASHVEQLGNLCCRVSTGVVHLHEKFLLSVRQLRLFPTESPFRFRDLHAFARSGTNQIGFELGNHGEHVKQESSDRIIGVVDGFAVQSSAHTASLPQRRTRRHRAEPDSRGALWIKTTPAQLTRKKVDGRRIGCGWASRNPSVSYPMGNETHEIACSYEHRQGGLCRILRPVSCPWGFETRRVSAVGFGHDTS